MSNSAICGKCNFKFSSDHKFFASGIINVTKLMQLVDEIGSDVVIGRDGCKYIKFKTGVIAEPKDYNTHVLIMNPEKQDLHKSEQRSFGNPNRFPDPIKVGPPIDDLPF